MLTRRSALAGATATVAMPAVATRAAGADFELKWGHSMPRSHPLTLRGMEAAEKIRTLTSGRVNIQLFPDSQLGADNDMTSQVRSGALELYTPGGSSIAPLVPVAGIITTAFAFEDAATGWKAMDGDLGRLIGQRFQKVGLHMFDKMWALGFRQITTASKLVNSPADLSRLKIRVPTSPMLLSLFEALGASPVAMNVTELYSALQTKVVDGQENPLSIILTRRVNEVQKYCALTNHVWDAFLLLANKAKWETIPSNFQDIISSTLSEFALLERQDIDKSESAIQNELTQKGMVFNTPDPSAFREALKKAGFYAKWKGVYGEEAWAALTKYAGPVG
jgi:tripartite ATP-independent transporter DctP family solute receptor